MKTDQESLQKQKEDLLKYFELLDSHHRFMLVAVAKLMVETTKPK